MGALGWILVGIAIVLANLLVWLLLYQREVGVLLRRIARLERRLNHREDVSDDSST